MTFKVSGGTQFVLDLDPDWTVKQVKEKCVEQTHIPVEAQRLIYKGAFFFGMNAPVARRGR